MNKYPDNPIPGDVFHPGEHLKDELEARGLKQKDLVEQTGLSKTEISLILNGKRSITPLIAVKLENALGIDAAFMMRLQVEYEVDKVRQKIKQKVTRSTIPEQKKREIHSRL